MDPGIGELVHGRACRWPISGLRQREGGCPFYAGNQLPRRRAAQLTRATSLAGIEIGQLEKPEDQPSCIVETDQPTDLSICIFSRPKASGHCAGGWHLASDGLPEGRV